MIRRDFATLGFLAHAIEARGRASTGTVAKVKSGYDGEEKKTRIFGRGTQRYMRRAAWRYLRKLARYAPRSYAHAAAEMIVHYGPEDFINPKGKFGAMSDCYMLVRVLYGGGHRFELDNRALKFKFRSAKQTTPVPGAREEAYPDLWDDEPRAYLRILGKARLIEAHQFAEPRIAGPHRDVLRSASVEEIIPLVDAPYEPTVALGVSELERRFDPRNPDWILLSKLLASGRPIVRDLGQRWLKLTAPQWTRDPDQTLAFLRLPDGSTRQVASELVVAHLAGASPEARRTLAERILALLRSPEAQPGEHDTVGRVARLALTQELLPLVTTSDLLEMITSGSVAAKSVAGELLGKRAAALDELGLERVLALAQHELAAVRAAAHALIRGAIDELRRDPELVFMLAESEWQDTRVFAFELLRTQIDIAALGLDGLIGLCDSNRVDVQDLGKELVRHHIEGKTAGITAEDVLVRLIQHPHSNMRSFALELAEKYLQSGAAHLVKIEPLARAILFDLWPDRKAKQRVIQFVMDRGLADEEQARVSTSILRDYVRTQGRSDFERVMESLVRIKLEYPAVASPVRLLIDESGASGAGGAP
jgi:hypothetical protein